MGEIRTRVTLENTYDREMVDRGHGLEGEVRRTTVDGIVDTLVIPEEVANELGLRRRGTRTVVYADERRDQRPVGERSDDRNREPHHRERVHDRTGGQRGADRPSSNWRRWDLIADSTNRIGEKGITCLNSAGYAFFCAGTTKLCLLGANDLWEPADHPLRTRQRGDTRLRELITKN